MRSIPTLLIAAMMLFVAACDSNSSDSFSEEAPAIISTEAFQMDTKVFGLSAKGQAGANFTAAALRVWPVSTIITANLIVPALVTSAATQSEPTFNGAWVWTNSASTDEGTATFTLTATPSAEGIAWEMKVGLSSPELVLDDFVLYTAQTALNGKSGSWQLYYEFDDVRENVLTADFEVTDSNTKSLTFSVTGGPYEAVGDVVTYRTDAGNREFDWSQNSENKTHLVQWDSVTKAGSITATDYNGGQMACWDADFNDTACIN